MQRVSLSDVEFSSFIQQIITYLEYLKLLFGRHYYMLRSFSINSKLDLIYILKFIIYV